MRVLITEQFNKAAKKLNRSDVDQVFNVFTKIQEMSKKEIFESRLLIKLKTSNENVYVIRSGSVRIFCTFESEAGNEDVIFLDVVRKTSPFLKPPANLTSR